MRLVYIFPRTFSYISLFNEKVSVKKSSVILCAGFMRYSRYPSLKEASKSYNRVVIGEYICSVITGVSGSRAGRSVLGLTIH